MKAIILEKPGHAVIQDIELSPLQSDEVLLRVVTSGICTNDVRDYNGQCNYSYPRIGGHEYCGIVEEIGSGVDSHYISKGKKAVTYINDDCKTCYYCKRGKKISARVFRRQRHSRILMDCQGIAGLLNM